MADGNLGSLWMSLGIKETVSDGLKKVLSSLDKTDEKSASISKEINSFIKELNSAKVSDSLLKSIGRIGELLSASTSGAESLGRVLKGLNVKEMSALGGNVNMSNLKEAHSLITKIMQAMSSRNMSNTTMDKFFDLGNAQSFLTQIMTIDKNLKSLKDSSKGVSDEVLKGDAKALVDKLTGLRKQFLETFNSGSWRGNNDIQAQLNDATNSLIKFYDKLNASKGNQSLFDSVPKEAAKANEALKTTEEQAKKTAEAVASIGTKRKPAIENQELAKEIERLTKNPASVKEGSNDIAGVKKQADDAKESVIKLRYELNEVLNAFRGAASKNLGIGEAGEKGRQLVDILNQINKKREELSRKEGGDEASREMGAMVNNAIAYLRLLQRIDIAERNLQDKKSANPNVDASKFKEASSAISHFREQLVKLESAAFLTGVDGANVLKNYASVWQMALGDVDKIIGKFQKRNPLSDLDSNFSKIDSKIDSFREKLAKLRDLMSEGTNKGFNTSMLTDRITGMSGIVAQMEKAMNNDGKMLSNADRMKQLFSDMQVEMSKTTAAFQAYGREKGKVIAQEREHNKELAKLEQQESRARSIAETISKVDRKIREFGETRDVSINLGASTTNIDGAIAKLSDLRSKLDVVDTSSKKDVANLISEYRILSNEIGNTKSKQDSLNRSIEAQGKKSATKATREANAAEKQRQSELENSLRRIQSMEKALANLQEKRFTSKMFGFDTTEADAKILAMKVHLNELYDIMQRLDRKDMSAVGKLGNLGNGRETQAANNLAQAYDKANKEAQRGVDIEQKRQQEIAKSAAKVQADLVRGFEKANSSAGKLNSTIQDLKSLFLQGGLVFGAQQFAMSIITTGGEMEKQHIALQSILGDMQNANTMFNQIKELALNSPFTFSELNRDVKQLAAYGVEYDQLYDTTKRLADMSSGLGVSFDRIALAFGQVQARGWLDGKELRQIAYAGIPLLDKLSKFYSKQEGRNVSTSEIKTRISNREVSFDDVKSIFWQMTDAGGQFYNMQQVLSETLLGRYNKLKDAWEIMLAEFASGDALVGKFFKTAIDGATALVQSLHTLAMPIGAIFAGYAFKKMAAGNTASSFLSNKANLASNIQNKVLQGQALTQIEQRILATKNQITGADLRALANARALTTEKLNQLRLSGKITAEQYNIYRGIVLRQTGEKTVRMQMLRTLATMRSMSLTTTLSSVKNVWTGFQASALAAFRVIGTGAKSLAAGIWSAIGGLPGLIITAVTFGITYAISEYQELSQKIKQTQDEIADKNKQIRDILRDNNVNIAISGGDTKEIDNMIDSYKEKLKELAPYSYKNMLMTAEEKKSHADRLKYLEQEIKLLKEANDIASTKLSNRGYYSDLSDATEDVIDAFKKREEMRVAAMASDASAGDKELYANEKAYDNYIESLKDKLAKKFGDIGKDEKMREAAMQAMSGIFSSIGVPEDKADIIRTSILQAFGCGDKSAWLQSEVSNSMISLIDKSFPMIGEKIKASIPLNDAEKAKVKELMNDAKNGLIRQYPELERTLQNMLAASNFQAVIRLVLDGGEKLNNLQSELVKRIPSRYSGLVMSETSGKYKAFAEKWGKEDSWYSARNAAQSDIDKAKNEYLSAKASKAKNAGELYTAWQTVKQAAKDLLYYDYEGAGKKSNKPVKNNNGGSKEDAELKRLQERLSSLKSARQMYQKYKSIMPDEEAKKKTYNLFPEVTGLDLDDYQKAVHSLLDGFKINTTERKKFQTSIYREVAEWLFDEKDKKEYEKKAAELTEEMNRLSDRWDLYKSLLEKTGNTWFARSAWVDAFQTDEKSKSLMDLYYQKYKKIFNMQEALSLTDGDAKEKLKGAGEYELWKKIVDLLRGNYVQSLQDGADAMQKMASYADKIRVINKKYDEKVKNQNDPVVVARMNRMRNQELGAASEEEFKGSSDYINFYGAIMSLGMDKAQKIGENIRKYLNDALSSGRIDAREYAKELKLLNEQLSKLTSPRKTFFNGGLKGLAEQKIQDANEQYTLASSKIAEGMKVKNLGEELGDDNLIARGNSMIESGKAMAKAASILFKDGTKAKESLDKFAGVVSVIDQNVQGMVEAFNDVKETAALLGADTESDAWQDASAFFETFSGMSNSISKVVSSAENGNIGGILAGTVGVFTSPIKSFAKAHDAKLDRQINLAERQLTELKNLSANISAVIEKTLGGIYAYQRSDATASKLSEIKNDYQAYNKLSKSNFWGTIIGGKNLSRYSDDTYNAVLDTDKNYSAYADQLALLKAQRDELQKQRNSEADKKKKDKDKLADYDQQLEEMGLQIKTFAQDFLKDIYSIDMKSWASELTDAVVGAWEKGEDAVDAYKDKVKSLVKDVTKSIVTQKFMEKALEKPLEFLTSELDKNGKLDESSMTTLVDMLYNAGEEAIPQITKLYDMLKERGLDLRENGSSSTTNSIKGVTEETADLLASYINDIRLNVSVDRENIKLIADAVTGLPELNVIAQSQLTAMNQLVTLAEYRNSKLDDMYSWMRAVTSGTGTKSIRMN